VQVKLVHWDVALRLLSASALSRLASLCPDYFSSDVLPFLLRHVDSPDLHRRHGCILGVAEILLALAQYPYRLGPELLHEVRHETSPAR
jgi:hypothetical protein